jgi:lysyl-tRNA synthetase class II
VRTQRSPNGGISSRFGTEIGTAYSELIDPIDQRERLVEQSLRAAAGIPRRCRSTSHS